MHESGIFFSIDTIIVYLKHSGTTCNERDRLKSSVKPPRSRSVAYLEDKGRVPSGPAAFQVITLFKVLLMSPVD